MPVFILLLYLLVGVSRHKALAILKITFSHGFEGIMSFSSRAKNPCAFLNSGACLWAPPHQIFSLLWKFSVMCLWGRPLFTIVQRSWPFSLGNVLSFFADFSPLLILCNPYYLDVGFIFWEAQYMVVKSTDSGSLLLLPAVILYLHFLICKHRDNNSTPSVGPRAPYELMCVTQWQVSSHASTLSALLSITPTFRGEAATRGWCLCPSHPLVVVVKS